MSTPTVSSFDLTPPRRPGKQDFNGVAKTDDEVDVPDVSTMFNAAEWNFIEWLLISLGRVAPNAVVSVTGTTNPAVNGVKSPVGAINFGTFTVTRTGVGNVRLSWPAGTFPSISVQPQPSLNQGPGMIHAVTEGNGVRVYTYDQTGTAADLSFTVAIG